MMKTINKALFYKYSESNNDIDNSESVSSGLAIHTRFNIERYYRICWQNIILIMTRPTRTAFHRVHCITRRSECKKLISWHG